jgi:hypothetical protein
LQRTGERQFKPLGAPDGFGVKFTPAQGDATELALQQPNGTFTLPRVNADGSVAKSEANEKKTTPAVTVDEVMAKTIEALGGEANWRKITSREMKYEIDFVEQGVKGYGTNYLKAPNLSANDSTFTALGKPIATAFEYFDGREAGQIVSFSPAEIYTGQRLEDIKIENDFYGLLNWKNGLKSAAVTATEKIGEEEAFVVVFRPEKASEFTYFISTKTFLPLKRTGVIVSSTSSQKLPVTQTFSDYRAIDGVMIPYKTVSTNPAMGSVVTYVKEVKNNVPVDDAKFKPKNTLENGKTKAAKN